MFPLPLTPQHYFQGSEVYDLDKDPKQVAKECVVYAVHRYISNTRRLARIERQINNYNGLINEKQYEWINKTYGKDNVIRYVDWRLGRTKINLLLGEYIDRPLPANVYSVNKDAMMEKLDNFHFKLGMKYSGKQINQLRNVAKFQVLDNMPIPQEDDEQLWKNANARTKNEMLMHIIMEKIITLEDIKTKTANEFLDLLLTSGCFSKTDIDENGITRYRDIPIKYAMAEYNERDPFLLQSPYMGERRPMFEHDIMMNFDLDDDERRRVKEMFQTQLGNVQNLFNGVEYKPYQITNGARVLDTFSIEWLAVKPIRIKKEKDKNGEFESRLSEDYYRKEKDRIDYEVKKGKYTVRTVKKLVVWEGSMIGDGLFTGIGEKKNRIGNLQNPYTTELSYSGLNFQSLNATVVSVQDVLDDVGHLYNLVMAAMRREISKAKGKVVPYNLAWLPAGKTINDVLYAITNDSIYQYNTGNDPDAVQKDQAMRAMLNGIDWGVSTTMGTLVELKRELERTADRLTGVNDDREGNSSASSTATNAVNNIENSRNITKPLFYFMNRKNTISLKKVLEYGKISYGILRQDLAATTLGPEAIRFLKQIIDISNDDFNLYLGDPGKELDIKRKLEKWTEIAINAKEMRVVDAAKSQLKDTANEAIQVLEKGWQTMENIRKEEMASKEKMNSEKIAGGIQAQRENREDVQMHEIDMVAMKGLIDQGLLTQEVANMLIKDLELAKVNNQMEADKIQAQNVFNKPPMQ